MSEITREGVLDLLRTGSPTSLVDFVRTLPETPMTGAALGLLGLDDAGMALVAVSSIAQQYAYGMDPALGEVLSAALHERAWELWNTTSDHGLLPTTLSGLASSHVKALSLLGRNAEIVEVAADYIRRYEALGEEENLPAFHVLRLEALVAQQKFDEAFDELRRNAALFEVIDRNPIWGMEVRRLRGRIESVRSSAADLPGTAPPPPTSTPEDMVEGLLATLGEDAHGLEGALRDLLAAGQSLDAADRGNFEELGRVLRQAEDFLSRGAGGENQLTIRRRIREASGIFVHGTPDRERILAALTELETCLAWASEAGVAELQNDANWGLYLCHGRLGQPSQAADALIALRSGLERRRAGIRDPMERGGVLRDYQYLFNALCEKLYEADRPADLLEAIESSKGRTIADRLTQQEGAPVLDSEIYRCVAALPEMTRREGFHYLTYFVDDERVYAVLVDKAGALHVPRPIELQRSALEEAAAAVDPRTWGRSRGTPGDEHPTANEVLAPLVSWLADLLEQGIVVEGDPIVYSPDEELYNVPLHYLRFRDGLVLDWFATSRVHTAFEIARSLEGAPTRPSGFAGFVVPSRQDLARGDDGKMISALRVPVDWLGAHLSGVACLMEEATVPRAAEAVGEDAVIHFSVHGVFPEGGNPYEGSYLLLADGQGLPANQVEVSAAGRLTPAIVLDRLGDLRGSHVSMMACVSGRAAEGLGGDALGLDWAFLHAGSSSLVSTHWNVSASAAASFFTLFYEKWLAQAKPRSQAVRETMVELLAGRRDADSLRAYAAFSLTGEYR